MRLRRTVAAAAALVAATALAACSSGAAPESAASVVPELEADQQVEIVFESYNLTQAGPWTDTVNQLLEEFHAEHPNITVKAQPPQGGTVDDVVSSVQTQLLAGDPPDVVQLGFNSLDFAASQLGAKAMNDLVGDEAVEEHFGGENPYHPRAKTLGDWNEKTYGMPYVFSTPMLFVNKTLLEEAGVPADADLSTWDEVQEAGAKVTAMTGKPSVDVACFYASGEWCLQALVNSNGGSVISEDRTTIEFGSPEAAGAAERMAEMYEAGVLRNADSAAQLEGLAKGDTAFLLNSAAVQGMLLEAAEAGGWELGGVGLPAFEGQDQSVPVNSGSALYILSDDEAKQRAAWELVSFLTSDRAFELITSQIGYLPLRTGLTDEGGALHEWAQSIPTVQPNLDQLDRLEAWRSFPGNSYTQVSDLFTTAAEEVVYYGKPAEETMSEAADRAQALID
ncbi:ABC transporter substrate-binding protein [Leucobacter sp. CSA1]|uniref:ABC transporter substrate-binding protein n=1 Tax=Leucobacter chromiisoli TaxID=2796471 RepID=A0A934UUF9_9MICO|nr:ABC transporter substrate-binding protein [Leucobacter chromiisoli]MBK0419449.1 ABC transporter substrate-binding protein [Leucobacter chromiisoli]